MADCVHCQHDDNWVSMHRTYSPTRNMISYGILIGYFITLGNVAFDSIAYDRFEQLQLIWKGYGIKRYRYHWVPSGLLDQRLKCAAEICSIHLWLTNWELLEGESRMYINGVLYFDVVCNSTLLDTGSPWSSLKKTLKGQYVSSCLRQYCP